MFNLNWPFFLSWELWLFRRIIQKQIAILISLVPTPWFPLRSLLVLLFGFILFQESSLFLGQHADTLLQKLLSPHCLAVAIPFLVPSSLSTAWSISFGSVPHSILISAVLLCCRCKGLGRGGASAVTAWWGKEPGCFLLYTVQFLSTGLCLLSRQSHCYMIRNGKEVMLTVLSKGIRKITIFHIFLPLDSFLGLSYWYLIYFGDSSVAQPTHSYRKP